MILLTQAQNFDLNIFKYLELIKTSSSLRQRTLMQVTLPAVISVCIPLRAPVVILVFLCFGSQRKRNLTVYGPVSNSSVLPRSIRLLNDSRNKVLIPKQ
jgi:hypothetical protein